MLAIISHSRAGGLGGFLSYKLPATSKKSLELSIVNQLSVQISNESLCHFPQHKDKQNRNNIGVRRQGYRRGIQYNYN